MISRRLKAWLVAGLVVALAVTALAAFYDSHGRNRIVEAEMRANLRVTPSLFSAIWPNHGMAIDALRQEPLDVLRAAPVHARIDESLKPLLRDQPSILKVKLLTISGRILYSTDSSELGHIQAESKTFQEARQRRAASTLITADALLPGSRDEVSSMIPVFVESLSLSNQYGRVPALIFDVHSDVSGEYAAHKDRLTGLVATATLLLALVASAIVMFGRRAALRVYRAEKARQAQHDAVQREALRDSLTGLPNRLALSDWIAAAPAHGSATLFCIDLDRFKLINDALGQAVGDRVLVHAADRISAASGERIRLYRLGSDEFVAVTSQMDGDAASRFARLLIETFAEPIAVNGEEISTSISVGFAQWPADHRDLEQVLRCADLAMVAAKASEARRWSAFDPDMRAAADEQVALTNGLRRARDQKQFILHYQPRLNGTTLEVECVEALLRWQHPEEGLLPPARFIEALENSPLIIDVGRWVMETACHQAVQWHRLGLTDLRMSVNVAARQFNDDDFPTTVAEVLARTGMPPAMLELELTETQLISQADNSLARIERLKALGVKLSIDDFGTGYSALSYLQRMPIDCLKIDRSFVSEVDDQRDGQIAGAIAGLARGLGMAVVAEGVETAAQEQAARRWGCDQVQGFLYSPPVSSEAIPELIGRHQRKRIGQAA